MDAVDASTHYEVSATAETPALLTIILDTNPRAWAALADTLPLSRAVANLLVFANAHLALSSRNQVAVIASHSNRAVWLYPSARPAAGQQTTRKMAAAAAASSSKRKRDDHHGNGADDGNTPAAPPPPPPPPNKFPQFREIETTLLAAIRDLVATTTEHDLAKTTTLLSGALTLALAHINKTAILIPAAAAAAAAANGAPGTASGGGAATPSGTQTGPGTPAAAQDPSAVGGADAETGLHARILVLSVSDASPAQYIPTMNAVFAAAHAGVAIDVLALRGAATFLQQAAFITRGTFLAPPLGDSSGGVPDSSRQGLHAQGILSYLMLGFNGAAGRDVAHALVAPSADAVDFRAACFCHRRVVDTGFVCSICLSIFCEVPPPPAPAPGDSPAVAGAVTECLTCGSVLRLGNYGAKPAVVPRPKKKKKKNRLAGASGREGTGSTAGTPMA